MKRSGAKAILLCSVICFVLPACQSNESEIISGTKNRDESPNAESKRPATAATPALTPRSLPSPPQPKPQQSPTTQPPPPKLTEKKVIPEVEIFVTANSKGEFSPSKIRVRSGQSIYLVLNNGDKSKRNVRHDWVLVKPGTEKKVASKQANMNSGDPNFDPYVLAETDVVTLGEQASVYFQAPEKPGHYPFFSSPNWPETRGELIVESPTS